MRLMLSLTLSYLLASARQNKDIHSSSPSFIVCSFRMASSSTSGACAVAHPQVYAMNSSLTCWNVLRPSTVLYVRGANTDGPQMWLDAEVITSRHWPQPLHVHLLVEHIYHRSHSDGPRPPWSCPNHEEGTITVNLFVKSLMQHFQETITRTPPTHGLRDFITSVADLPVLRYLWV